MSGASLTPRQVCQTFDELSGIQISLIRQEPDPQVNPNAFMAAVIGSDYEERIAPLLDPIGRDGKAALHLASAAGCFAKSGHLSRAVNLYGTASAGPRSETAKMDVELNNFINAPGAMIALVVVDHYA